MVLGTVDLAPVRAVFLLLRPIPSGVLVLMYAVFNDLGVKVLFFSSTSVPAAVVTVCPDRLLQNGGDAVSMLASEEMREGK